MKHILVTFDLGNANANQYRAAYEALAQLGLSGVQQNVILPSTTVMGLWMMESPIEEIRQILLNILQPAIVG